MIRGVSGVDIGDSPFLQMFALLSIIVLIGIFYGALRRNPGSNEKEWRLVACEMKKDKNGLELLFGGADPNYMQSLTIKSGLFADRHELPFGAMAISAIRN